MVDDCDFANVVDWFWKVDSVTLLLPPSSLEDIELASVSPIVEVLEIETISSSSDFVAVDNDDKVSLDASCSASHLNEQGQISAIGSQLMTSE